MGRAGLCTAGKTGQGEVVPLSHGLEVAPWDPLWAGQSASQQGLGPSSGPGGGGPAWAVSQG